MSSHTYYLRSMPTGSAKLMELKEERKRVKNEVIYKMWIAYSLKSVCYLCNQKAEWCLWNNDADLSPIYVCEIHSKLTHLEAHLMKH